MKSKLQVVLCVLALALSASALTNTLATTTHDSFSCACCEQCSGTCCDNCGGTCTCTGCCDGLEC